ncbi:hypothetical protein BJV82DRAFT_573358 [Fennellomyces sp. T-0311]|nr:hypothetical protein BJV82DRAFT_573358 [Fennellomyces sp. T-0311]
MAPTDSKVILITGSTSGIGRAVAKGLLAEGHTVIIAGRSHRRIDEAVGSINPSPRAAERLRRVIIDLESLESIKSSVEQFKALGLQLDVLINNAGINSRNLEYVQDTNKVEKSIFVNAVAPFYLSVLLAPHMQQGGRVMFATSGLHKPGTTSVNTAEGSEVVSDPNLFDLLDGKAGYDGFRYYRISKLAMIWITYVLPRQFPHLTAFAYDPGFVPTTNLGRDYSWFLRLYIRIVHRSITKPEELYVSQHVYYSTSPKLNGVTGEYFSDGKKSQSSERSHNMDDAIKFWNLSCEICNIPEYKQIT